MPRIDPCTNIRMALFWPSTGAGVTSTGRRSRPSTNPMQNQYRADIEMITPAQCWLSASSQYRVPMFSQCSKTIIINSKNECFYRLPVYLMHFSDRGLLYCCYFTLIRWNLGIHFSTGDGIRTCDPTITSPRSYLLGCANVEEQRFDTCTSVKQTLTYCHTNFIRSKSHKIHQYLFFSH